MLTRLSVAIFVMCFTFAFALTNGQEKAKTDPPAKTETPKTDAAKSDAKKPEELPSDKKSDSKSNGTDEKKTDTKTDDKKANKTDAKEDKKAAEGMKWRQANAPSKEGPVLQDLLNKGIFPSPKQLDAPLRARDELYQKMILDAYSLVRRLDINARIFRDRYTKKKVDELTPNEVALSHVANVMLGRYAEGLILRKEPAGEDLMVHFRQNGSIIGVVAKEISERPDFPKDAIKRDLDKIQKNIERLKPKLEKMVEAKQYYQVEQEIIAILDNLEYLLIWVPNERAKFSTFTTIRQKYRGAMVELERGEVKKRLFDGMSNLKQDGFDLHTLIPKAAAGLKNGAETTWNGKTLTGPQLIDAVRDEWMLAQPRILKHQAIAYCLQDSGGNLNSSNVHASAANYDKYTVDLLASIATIIDSDAVDCKGDEIAPLYVAYLQSVAALKSQLGNPASAFKLDQALDKLAAKDPKLDAQVKAYKTITQPILDWRMNLTNEQVAAQSEDMPTIGSVVKNVFREDKKMLGFMRTSDPNYLGVIDPVLPTLRRRGGRLLNRSVSCYSVITNPAFPDRMFAMMDESCYGMIPAPKNVAVLKKEIDFLKSDLLVDDKNPPLSLNAALAIWKAENGYWAAVGTEVKFFAVEPTYSLVFALPDDEIFFSPLGRMPSLGKIGHLFFRFDYGEPYWLRHDYFYCDLGLE